MVKREQAVAALFQLLRIAEIGERDGAELLLLVRISDLECAKAFTASVEIVPAPRPSTSVVRNVDTVPRNRR